MISTFNFNLLEAVNFINGEKEKDAETKFRLETCIKKDQVRVYTIKNGKIIDTKTFGY